MQYLIKIIKGVGICLVIVLVIVGVTSGILGFVEARSKKNKAQGKYEYLECNVEMLYDAAEEAILELECMKQVIRDIQEEIEALKVSKKKTKKETKK